MYKAADTMDVDRAGSRVNRASCFRKWDTPHSWGMGPSGRALGARPVYTPMS